MNLASLPHVVDNLPNDEYHAMTDYVSNSMLKVFIASRRKFEAIYIDKSIAIEPTDATKLGTAAHTLLLEPERIGEVAVEIPAGVLSDAGHRKGKPWLDWEKRQPRNAALLTPVEWGDLAEQVQAVWANDRARVMLEHADGIEESIFWQDSRTGLNRKCRLDARAGRFILDLKSTKANTPQRFRREILDYGYHFQGTGYEDGVRASTLIENPVFVLAALTKARPYAFWLKPIGEASKRVARHVVDSTLTDLATCHETGDWSDPGEEDFEPIDIPDYELRKHKGVI